MTLARVRTTLTGFPGGPGVATHYFLDPVGAVAALRAFWLTAVTQMPIDVTARVQNSGDTIDPADGAIVGTWTQPAVLQVQGSSDTSYPAPVGAIVRWLTTGVVDGRKVRGGTFVVPLFGGAYQTDGTLAASAQTTLEGAAATLVLALPTSFCVWHRPQFGPKPVGGGARPILRPGSAELVTGSSVPDRVVVLRSRRD